MKTKRVLFRYYIFLTIKFCITYLIFSSPTYADNAGLLISKGVANRYNYAPSVMMDSDGTQKMWWCAGGESPHRDVIYYRSINTNTQQLITNPIIVLSPAVGSGLWDSQFICDPSVIKGNFIYPDGSGRRYLYAMYYTATDNTINGGINNGIGVAYSNDGITWLKWPFPIFRTNTNEYGIGQQSAISADGGSGVWLFVLEKLTSVQSYNLYYSPDAVHLQYKLSITKNGVFGNFITEADFAFDANTGFVYMVTNRMNDEGTIDLYKILWGDLANGTWQFVSSLGINGNFKPTPLNYKYNGGAGFLRNQYGNNTSWLPILQIFFGAGIDINSTDLWWWQTKSQ